MNLEKLADSLLVCRVRYRPEQAHTHCLHRASLDFANALDDGIFIQRHDNRAIHPDPFRNLESQRPRHVRLRIGNRVVEGRKANSASFPDHQDVTVALGRHKGRLRRVLGQDRIGGNGRAMNQELSLFEQNRRFDLQIVARLSNGSQQAPDWIVRGGRGLVHAELAAIILDYEVSKRTSCVDREPHLEFPPRRVALRATGVAPAETKKALAGCCKTQIFDSLIGGNSESTDHGTSTSDPGAFREYGGHRVAAIKRAEIDDWGTDLIMKPPPGQSRTADHNVSTRLALAGAVMLDTDQSRQDVAANSIPAFGRRGAAYPSSGGIINLGTPNRTTRSSRCNRRHPSGLYAFPSDRT